MSIHKTLIICLLTLAFQSAFSQENEKVSVLEFVEIIDDQREEALYYYQNNWKIFRIAALENGYIESFQLIEIPYSEELPAHLVLMTQFKNAKQYENAEVNFKKVMSTHGEMRLLNDKSPNIFRKNVMMKVSKAHHD